MIKEEHVQIGAYGLGLLISILLPGYFTNKRKGILAWVVLFLPVIELFCFCESVWTTGASNVGPVISLGSLAAIYFSIPVFLNEYGGLGPGFTEWKGSAFVWWTMYTFAFFGAICFIIGSSLASKFPGYGWPILLIGVLLLFILYVATKKYAQAYPRLARDNQDM